MPIEADLLALLEAALKKGSPPSPFVRDWHEWRLTRLLGGGGMAFVVEATPRWARQARPVALKLARQDYAHVFLGEGRAVQWPEHPNLVRVDAVGAHDYVHFLVMELLDGVPGDALPAPMRRDRPLLDFAADLARGLAFLHDRGWLHRDLKPSNTFLVRRDGLAPQGKLIDFGLVRDEAVDSVGSRTGAAVGTFIYQAPERFAPRLEDRRSTQRTDVFAFGLTLAALATGRHLFADVLKLQEWEREAGMGRVVREVEERVKKLGAELDRAYPGLGSVVLDCVRVDPKLRPDGGGSVLARLEALAGPPPRLEEVPTRPVRSGPSAERSEPATPAVREEAGAGWRIGPVGLAAVGLLGAAAVGLGTAAGFAAGRGAAPAAEPSPADEPSPTDVATVTPPPHPEPVAVPAPGERRLVDGVGELRWVPAADGGFWMMREEVTGAQFAPASPGACPNCAAGGMTLEQAEAWVTGLPAVEGARWALPSDEQWTTAARAGGTTAYAGGDDAQAVGWVRENSADRREPREGCGRAENAWGLCDLTGNVAEWTAGGGLRGGAYTTPAADSGVDKIDARPNAAFTRPFVGFRAVLVPAGEEPR